MKRMAVTIAAVLTLAPGLVACERDQERMEMEMGAGPMDESLGDMSETESEGAGRESDEKKQLELE